MIEPSVTVLIDTYNYGRFIGRAIESVLGQTYPPEQIEILVVDDGSTDDTAAVVARFGPRVRYLPKPNGGQASALNLGFREARGEIVCLLDADDYFYPDKVSRVAAAVRETPEIGLIYNEFDILHSNGHRLPKHYPERTWTGCTIPPARIPEQLQALILLGHPWSTTTSAMAVRRSAVRDLEIPEEVFPHSPDLFLALVLPFLTRVAVITTPLTGYVYHGDNVGLFRSSAQTTALYALQLACARRYVEQRLGRRFISYGGRSIYGAEAGERVRGTARLGVFAGELRRIGASGVEGAVKRRCIVKLAASLLFPDPVYARLRAARSLPARLHSRAFHRRLEALSRGEV